MGPQSVSSGLLLCVSLCALTLPVMGQNDPYTPVKIARFHDPHTSYQYRVVSYNSTSMTTESVHRSFIKVYRVKLNEGSKLPIGEQENIQTVNFHPTLVDFDLHCQPTHCYLVAITSRSKRNVELYSWQRTQFDLLAKRDSFARPHAVRLFRIGPGFYITVAQDQLHLSPYKPIQEDEEPTRFFGCPILKFARGHEHSLKYHQYIRLPFNPIFVNHFVSNSTNNINSGYQSKLSENHYLAFSITPNWQGSGSTQAASFKWSPLNDYFWPYRLPSGAFVGSRPGYRYPVLKLPSLPPALNLTNMQPSDQVEAVEICFNQLQRLLTDRELYSRRLIDSSRSLWRSPHLSQNVHPIIGLTNISAQVIVYGNVIVRGSLIESPQISLIGHRSPDIVNVTMLSNLANAHSPAIVENKLRQAFYKLKHVRDKLSRAITSNPANISFISSRVRFFGNVRAKQVIFRGNGISNSNVRLNGIPFGQLEHELVSLSGVQDIAAKVVFQGNVVADKLEIHGLINGNYFLKDTVDITSQHVQIFDSVSNSNSMGHTGPVFAAIGFYSVGAPPGLTLSHNAMINDIRLDDFITRDDRTQLVHGRKSFKNLSIAKLSLAHPHVLLNGFNLSRNALNSLHLRNSNDSQHVNAGHLTFSRQVIVDRLIVNNFINRHINLSSLIHDSVKTYDVSRQQISGLKRFLQGLKISSLTTEGSINGIPIDQVFNLNPTPPVPDYVRYTNYSAYNLITGNFSFQGLADIHGYLNAGQINGIDVAKRAIRRTHPSYDNSSNNKPQLVSGQKIFMKTLRVTDRIRVLDEQQLIRFNYSSQALVNPLINNIDIRRINENIMNQMKIPPVIYVDNLEINGNLNLSMPWNRTGPQILGNYTRCPLDLIRSKLILAGNENQLIDIPIRIDSLRSRTIHLEPGSLNGLSFPSDFVLKSPTNTNDELNVEPKSLQVELVFGHKTFDQLAVVPTPQFSQFSGYDPRIQPISNGVSSRWTQDVLLGSASSVNNITYTELQAFISHEHQKNSTGETVLQTLHVHGTIFAKRVNGYSWPDDILLKSIGSNMGSMPSPYLHRRIYSPLIFINSSSLQVENQLVLRGPIQLGGRLNGVNLTQFARQSATYGDKDLLSSGRPIANKVFMGGLTVKGEIRSQGLIDGVNMDEMRKRVVTIGSQVENVHVTGPKIFMSDVEFLAPVSTVYLNDFPLDHYLKRVQFQPGGGNGIQIFGKKTVTGALRVNRNLIVQGLINGIDFVDLKAHAISLSPLYRDIEFNKTLTIEGDAFMDNLLIDEKDGIIDGVKLTNLLPVNSIEKNELVISAPVIARQNTTQGYNLILVGQVNDSKISCSLSKVHIQNQPLAPVVPIHQSTSPQIQSAAPQQHFHINYPLRQIQHNGKNITYMRTTPPYVSTVYQPPLRPREQQPPPPPSSPPKQLLRPSLNVVYPDQSKVIQSLAQRKPVAIMYERPLFSIKYPVPQGSPIVKQQLDFLRQQIISLNLIRLSESSDLVVGFIESALNDLAHLLPPEQGEPPSSHAINATNQKSFLVLDQIDFPFRPTTYHLSVGVSTNYQGLNVTSVYSSVGGGDFHTLSVLPIESPNSAMFLTILNRQNLFLLISQDNTNRNGAALCPRYANLPSTDLSNQFNYGREDTQQMMGEVHVYLFHALQNSSSLSSAYFDLYQTIGLPAIDSFENFDYRGTTYALAISRQTERVYLMILRGYSGFQVVSYIDAPTVEYVKVFHTGDLRPMLIIFQSNGLHRLMESVII